ncbi:MAG: capsule assembly Wzi family protein [Pseudomonadota bacterium]
MPRIRSLTFRISFTAWLAALSIAAAHAGPWLEPGDPWLKADVLLLADSGVITSPVSSWPLSWGDIAQDLNAFTDDEALRPDALAALRRLRDRAADELIVGQARIDAGIRVAEKPPQIRGFLDAPRGEQEVWGKAEWTGERIAVGLRGSYVNDDSLDDDEGRYDGSYAAVAVGNWMIGASAVDRWWGPGWNGSMILSNSARPIPGLVIERNFSTPFESRWLSWIGPWSTSVIWGFLEDDRAVSRARFFGWRINFRPLRSLEIGLLRAAQWCGSGRSCDLDAFAKILVGDSNLDDGNGEDVANQLAGFDGRWTSPIGDARYAVYGQLIGEDEAGGFPSRYLGQFGLETWGVLSSRNMSWRLYAEVADSTCQFNESSKRFNCAYENSFYPDGYRFENRPIGHATDGDSRSFALGAVIADLDWGRYLVTLRRMEVNRGGAPQPTHSISPIPVDITDIDIVHRRSFQYVDLEIGAGYERRDFSTGGSDQDDLRIHVGLTMRL